VAEKTGDKPETAGVLTELPADEIAERIREGFADMAAKSKQNNRPKRPTAPVITPLKGGYTRSRYKPQALSSDDINRWRRKDAWTICATAFLLCGHRPPDEPPSKEDIPPYVIEAAEDMGLARMRGRLHPVGPADVLGRQRYVKPEEIIEWAADRFPRFPFAKAADIAQTAEANPTTAARDGDGPPVTGYAEPEIVLPAEQRLVPTLDIPRLVAKALYPPEKDAEERTVSYLMKMMLARPHGERLSNEDMDLLNRIIWPHLPPYRNGMTATEWVPYKAAYDTAEDRPEWEPVPVWNNPALNNGVARASAEEQYKALVAEAIHDGRLTAVSHAGMPMQGAFVGNGVYVAVPELRRYLATLPLPIRVRLAEQAERGSKCERPQPVPHRAVSKTEQHARAILKAILDAGYDPLALPKQKQGSSGVRSEIRKRMPTLSKDQFNDTWKLLRSTKRTATK